MKIAIPTETAANETRVAASDSTVRKYVKAGLTVTVQSGAGLASELTDDDYKASGAEIASDFAETVKDADIVLKIRPPNESELSALPRRCCLVCPADERLFSAAAKAELTWIDVERIPRITRAQSMDVLSSQSNLTGYKAVLEAVNTFQRVVPMMTTAAGTIKPAVVLVAGVGVAGLQAVATAKRLGADVWAYDIRPEVKEQVTSLGAKFISTDGYTAGNAKSVLKKAVAEADIVITAALSANKKAPLLITEAMVKSLKKGSVVFDLAAEQGGNCYGTLYGKTVKLYSTTLIGRSDIVTRLCPTASRLYAENLYNLIIPLIDKENLNLKIDLDDAIYNACCVLKNGRVLIKENAHE